MHRVQIRKVISKLGDTVHYRQGYSMPSHLETINRDPDDNDPHCLDTMDTEATGECSVVCFDLVNKISIRIAPNFVEYCYLFGIFETSD
jgi:hypothetical protein